MQFSGGQSSPLIVASDNDGFARFPDITLSPTTASGTLHATADDASSAVDAPVTVTTRKLVWVKRPIAPERQYRASPSGVGVKLTRVDGTPAEPGEAITFAITTSSARWGSYYGSQTQTKMTDASGYAESSVVYAVDNYRANAITVTVSHPAAASISYQMPTYEDPTPIG